jgi:hypothetical protein
MQRTEEGVDWLRNMEYVASDDEAEGLAISVKPQG